MIAAKNFQKNSSKAGDFWGQKKAKKAAFFFT